MSGAERILDYLAGAKGDVCDDCISLNAKVSPRQTVYQICEYRLTPSGRLTRGSGRCIVCGRIKKVSRVSSFASARGSASPTIHDVHGLSAGLPATGFEDLARKVFSERFGTQLRSRDLNPSFPKRFDLVSKDQQIVGDAKYYTLVGGNRLPPAKFSIIAEHVWLLEKVSAKRKLLVFGNDRRVPERWLSRYGALVRDVEFFFWEANGTALPLWPTG